MKIASIKWILFVSLFLSVTTHSESIQQVEIELLRLEKQSLSYDSNLINLTTQLQPLAKVVEDAKTELNVKEKELKEAGAVMQAAFNKYYTDSTTENEREAKRLSREFTLAERSTSRQILEVERAERDYNEVAEKIKSLKQAKQSTLAEVAEQKARIASLKAKAIAAANEAEKERLAQALAKKIQRQKEAEEQAKQEQQQSPQAEKNPELNVAENSNTTTTEKPATETPKSADKPEEKAPSLNEQEQNINRVINGGGWSSGF